MTPQEFEAFSEALTRALTADDRVIGLVAMGSMAAVDYQPDAFSDHDFLVIVPAEWAEQFRVELSWIPTREGCPVTIAFREGPHGLKVVYADGHLLEFGVLDPDDLARATSGRSRVLLDRGSVAETIAAISTDVRPDPARLDLRFEAGQIAALVLVAIGRYQRGEWLSAHQFLTAHATGHLLRALTVLPSEQRALLDGLDARRRFEVAHPALGAELRDVLSSPVPVIATGLLAILQRELGDRLPADATRAVRVAADAVRRAAP